ncbi:hypothetical protein CBR56_29495 [Bacillus thuringiensis]
MHSIKRYKKMGIVVPLACLLGTGFTFVNQPIHAAAAVTTNATVTNNASAEFKEVDLNTLRGDLYERYFTLLLTKPELIGGEAAWKSWGDDSKANYNIKYNMTQWVENLKQGNYKYFEETWGGFGSLARHIGQINAFLDWNPQYSNTTKNYDLKAIPGDINHDSIEVYKYTNPANSVEQKFLTDAKDVEIGHTFTETHTTGGKFGYNAATTFKVGVPLNQATTTHTFTFEANYNYTNTHTKTDKETKHYPSQTVICKPGYTTKLTIDKSTATYTGDLEFDIGASAEELITKINANIKDLPNHTNKNYKGPKTTIKADSEEFLYNLYKYSGYDLPSYITLDDEHKTVSFGKVKSTYSGVTGTASEMILELIPIDPKDTTKKPIKMLFKEYQQKMKNNEPLI